MNLHCTAGQPKPNTGGPTSSQACAWPTLVDVGASNVGLPDAAAAYWLDSFRVYRDLRITLAGRYPDARYASISVYNNRGDSFNVGGVGSSLTDYRIAPDPGSHNPWQQTDASGGHFTVTLRPDASPDQVNTLPLAPTGTADGTVGHLQYRVYLPAAGDFSKVVAPTITLKRGGSSTTLRPCPKPGGPAAAGPRPTSAPPSPQPSSGGTTRVVPGPLHFYNPAGQAAIAGFPNADSAYLLAGLIPPAADSVVVVRAKALVASTGDHPSPWPVPGVDVRYWSMCVYLGTGRLPLVVNPLSNGTSDLGCRYDQDTKLDTSREYTYILGTESQRAAIERLPDVTFLPLSTAEPGALHVLLLRNMLVNGSAGLPVQQAPADGNPASAAAVLGVYYPRTGTCALSALVAQGPQACLPRA